MSVTSQCSTETAKCRITQTMPHDSPGTRCLMLTISAKLKQNHPKRRCQKKVGYVKIGDFQQITCDNSKMLTVACQLSSVKFITLSIHLCLQHVCHDAVHRMGSVSELNQRLGLCRCEYINIGLAPIMKALPRQTDQRSCASRDLWSVKMFVLADLRIFIESCLFFCQNVRGILHGI